MTDHYRRSLSNRQKQTLARFEKKRALSPYEQGQLAAFRIFGDDDEQKRADRLLRRVDKENKNA